MGKIDSQRLLDVPKADRLNKTPVAGQIVALEVAGSIPVARPIFLNELVKSCYPGWLGWVTPG